MPRLLIDATPVKVDPKGVGRYAYHVCLQMAARLPDDWDIQALVHSEVHDVFPQNFRAKLVVVRQVSEIVHGVRLASYARKVQADILLKTMESAGQLRIPTAIICHDIDALILEAQSPKRSVFRRYIDAGKHFLRRRALQGSDFIICNSEFTRAAVQRHYNIPLAKTAVACCAVDPRFYEVSRLVDKEKLRQKYGVQNFVLTFATGDPRENFKLLPTIAQKLREFGISTCLLIAGVNLASSYVAELRAHFYELGLIEGKHFIFESFLGEDRFADLVALYSAADFYLELSLHEGFGMQLAEAMACGTTCITSPNGALEEVSGGYGIFLDPTGPGSIATVIKASYEAKLHLRDNHAQVDYTHKFSWDEMGKVLTKVLLKLAENKSLI